MDTLLQEALQQTPDGFGIFDSDDRVVFCNAPFAELFNHTQDSIIGKTFAELVRHAHETRRGINVEAKDVEAWLEDALQKRRSKSLRSFQTDTVDGRWFQVTEKMAGDNHMFIFFADITPQKQSEQKLKEMVHQLEHLAQTDELTGANNRRHFLHLASRELARSLRYGHPATLLLLDIDNFKDINDTFGHDAGDKVLSGFARRIKRELRQFDIFGRLGGEEFAIVLPETPIEAAMPLAERLKERVAKLRFIETGSQCNITVSISVAPVTDEHRYLEQLIALAEEALVKAKAKGSNQVVRAA